MQFVLQTFSQDEEIQTIHLPVIFAGIVDLINVRISFTTQSALIHCFSQLQMESNPAKASSRSIRESLILLEEMLRRIPHSGLMQRPEVVGDNVTARITERAYTFACTFFNIPATTTPTPSGSFAIPFSSSFESLIGLSTHCAQNLNQSTHDILVLREVFSQSLKLIDRLVGRLGSAIAVQWRPHEWLTILLESLQRQVRLIFLSFS